jgi:diguanylate cyclase (GGDEF)-like protein
MPPPVRLPACPARLEACPVLSEIGLLQEECRRLQEECRRLQKLSQTDPLTGLFNRRYLMNSLEQEMERTRRTGLPTSLIMMDLDHFKRLNDTYGHPFGDTVLCHVATVLKDNLRKLDIPCRYGGEEFAVILPGTRLPQAVRLAMRLKNTLGQGWEEPQGGTGRLTASFGVDTFTGREELSRKKFVQQADRWLFVAKAQGRNTVCHPDSSPLKDSGGGLTREEQRAFFPADNPQDGKAGESYG